MATSTVKDTSRVAYQMSLPSHSTIRKKVLAVMEPDRIYTFRQLAKAAGLRDEQVWKRLSEMRDKDKTIEEAGKLTCPISSRYCTGWKKIEH